MVWYDFQERNDNSYIEHPDGSGATWSGVRVYDYWETYGPDNKPYATGSTRKDAILLHHQSNLRLKAAQDEINELRRKKGEPPDYEMELIPVSGVRHRVRYELSSGWEQTDLSEDLDDVEAFHTLMAMAKEKRDAV